MAKGLTPRQRSVLMRIGEGLLEQNYPPTLREIGSLEGITSTNGVRCVLEALEKKKYITRKRYQSRAIELTETGKSEVMKEMGMDVGNEVYPTSAISISLNETVHEASRIVQIPLLGRVAAGLPLLAQENIDTHIAIDADYAPKGDTFALRVKGQSMIEAGIHDGDVVFCRAQDDAETGDIVVALIGDEATVKYFHPEDDHIILKPANEFFGAIVIDHNAPEFRIIGKVVSLFRRYG
ncbi:MAG: transcriptional repressor LexA [Candidatus Electryonea clarkiae]|nr:transcriptional repressor LexA [Candidatus Electryonea clarkiae]MDP8287811.1 transcriptional repressor LexA [Candidatus Electryonea clarkiae]